MGKKNTKGAAAKVAALTPEEFQKLTPEEQLEHLNKLQQSNSELAEKAALAEGKVKDVELPSVEVEEDVENGIDGGDYQFHHQNFRWDDGNIINVVDLVADAEGKDKIKAAKATSIIANLVKRKSGVLQRKED